MLFIHIFLVFCIFHFYYLIYFSILYQSFYKYPVLFSLKAFYTILCKFISIYYFSSDDFSGNRKTSANNKAKAIFSTISFQNQFQLTHNQIVLIDNINPIVVFGQLFP